MAQTEAQTNEKPVTMVVGDRVEGLEENNPRDSLAPEPICEQSPYPRYEPGTYDAECLKARTYRDPQFRCWKCQLEFSILPEGDRIWGFLNLGPGKKPKAGPRSEYYRAWIIANGQKPRKRQTLSPRVFQAKMFEIQIVDVTRRHDGRDHPEAQVYSVVRQIVRKIY